MADGAAGGSLRLSGWLGFGGFFVLAVDNFARGFGTVVGLVGFIGTFVVTELFELVPGGVLKLGVRLLGAVAVFRLVFVCHQKPP